MSMTNAGTTPVNPAHGSSGTIGAIIDTLHSTRIPLPVIGGVSAGTLLLGVGLIYFAFFRKKSQTITLRA